MSCGAGAPIADQIDAAIFAGQLIGGTTLDEAKLQLGRMVNSLVGSGDKEKQYRKGLGGMRYEPSTGNVGEDEGLGNGIIPDLDAIIRGRDTRKYPLRRDNAELALKLATIARDEAVKGRDEAERLEHEQAKAIARIKQSAKVASSLLRVALDVVLA